MKEVVLFALLYLCFYGMSLLDSDLSSFTHNVSVIYIESAYCVHISEHSDQSFPLFFKQVVAIFTIQQRE